MTTTTLIRPTTEAELLSRARQIQPLLRLHAAETERLGRLAPAVRDTLRDLGFFRLTVPAAQGGHRPTLPGTMRILETLAAGDASAGWCAWVACAVPAMSAFLPEAGAAALLEPLDTVIANSQSGMGRAIAVEGGYRVSGSWHFVSGVHNATTVGGTCFIFDGDTQRMLPNGQPVVVFALWPAGATHLEDDWDTTGLRGTGSVSMSIEDIFVPASMVVDFSKPPRPGLDPLHYLNVENAGNVTCAALAAGIARSAIEAFRDIAATKKQLDGTPLIESPLARIALGNAKIRLGQARGHLYDTAEALWREAEAGTCDQQAWFERTALASTSAAEAAIDVVATLYRAAGSSAVFRGNRLERCLRDVYTLGAHKTVQHGNVLVYGGA